MADTVICYARFLEARGRRQRAVDARCGTRADVDTEREVRLVGDEEGIAVAAAVARSGSPPDDPIE